MEHKGHRMVEGTQIKGPRDFKCKMQSAKFKVQSAKWRGRLWERRSDIPPDLRCLPPLLVGEVSAIRLTEGYRRDTACRVRKNTANLTVHTVGDGVPDIP